MKTYQYASRTIFCKTQKDVDKVVNDEIYRFNKPEDVISINITPYVNPETTHHLLIPICFYVSYVYRYELNRY